MFFNNNENPDTIKKQTKKIESLSSLELDLISEAYEKYLSANHKKEYEKSLKVRGHKADYILIDAFPDEVMERAAELHAAFLKHGLSKLVEKSSDEFDKTGLERILKLSEKLNSILNDGDNNNNPTIENLKVYWDEPDDRFAVLGPKRYCLGVHISLGEKLFEIINESPRATIW